MSALRDEQSEWLAADIIAGIHGDKAQREAAYVELDAITTRGNCSGIVSTEGHGGGSQDAMVDVVAECIGPLIETVFAADVSVVDAAEFRRAQLVLSGLCLLDPLRLIGEWTRNGRLGIAWGTSGNAFATVFDKDPSELTRDDALTVAAPQTQFAIQWCRGVDATNEAGGITTDDWMGEWATEARNGRPGGNRLSVVITESPVPDAFLERLCLLSLEIIRDPQGASELELAGVWTILPISLSGRPVVAMALIEAGLLEVAVTTLQQSSPTDWITWLTRTGIVAAPILCLGWTLSTLTLTSKTQLLLEKGFVDVAISVLKAFELRGANKLHEASPVGIWAPIQMLGSLDLTDPEAKAIVRQLEAIPSALRFLLENSIDHIRGIGQTTPSPCSAVCALAFGKEEGGDFAFDQEMIDAYARDLFFWFSGQGSGMMPFLPPFFLTGMRCLCISEVNKRLLVQCPDLLTLVTEMLLLDPEHARQDQDEAIKAAIQKDASECFLQLALFEPGRQMLSEDTTAMQMLHSMANDIGGLALTEEAREYAYGAVMAIEGRAQEPEPQEDDDSDGHVMVSYQWDFQTIIQRVVVSLRLSGYLVWFDLDNMQGSTMDAMSDAVDNIKSQATVVSRSASWAVHSQVTHAVSALPTDEADVHVHWSIGLEATYAHQQGLILGSSLWYPFYDCEDDDDATFEKRLVPLKRAIGDRGKTKPTSESTSAVEEGVPPPTLPAKDHTSTVAAPAPQPSAAAPVPLPATPPAQEESALTRTEGDVRDLGFSPSMQAVTPFASSNGVAAPWGSTADIIALMREEREYMEVKMKEQKAEMKEQRDEMERHRKEMEKQIEQQRKETEARLSPAVAISAEQIIELQARVEKLHGSKLLTDDELFTVEVRST